MIYFSLGLPGPIARWCDAAIEHLLLNEGTAGNSIAFPAAGALPGVNPTSRATDQIAVSLVRGGVSRLIVGAHEPDTYLRDILIEERAPFVLALDDPRIAAADLSVHHDLKSAVRAIANACPFTMECMNLPGALLLGFLMLADGGHAAIRAIAHHLDIACDDGAALAIARHLLPLLPAQDWECLTPPESRRMVDGALGGYAAHFAGNAFRDLDWMPDLFSLGSDANRPPNSPIQLKEAGNGLFLVYGPYIRLPAGYWSAKIVMGISQEAVGQVFTIDVYSGQRLAMQKFSARAEGIFTIDVDFATDEASGHNIEVRIVVGRNSAPGQLAFGHVTMHLIALRQPNHVGEQIGDHRAAFLV